MLPKINRLGNSPPQPTIQPGGPKVPNPVAFRLNYLLLNQENNSKNFAGAK
jgi:hypothetical protein